MIPSCNHIYSNAKAMVDTYKDIKLQSSILRKMMQNTQQNTSKSN